MNLRTATVRASLQHASYIQPLTVTVAMARRISGLGNTTVWKLIKERKLEPVRVGRRTLVTVRSLEALLAPSVAPEPQPRRRGRLRKTAHAAGAQAI
jgi:hypothetical protein